MLLLVVKIKKKQRNNKKIIVKLHIIDHQMAINTGHFHSIRKNKKSISLSPWQCYFQEQPTRKLFVSTKPWKYYLKYLGFVILQTLKQNKVSTWLSSANPHPYFLHWCLTQPRSMPHCISQHILLYYLTNKSLNP